MSVRVCALVYRDLKPENILIKAVSVHLDDEGRELTSAEVTALAANPDSATSTRIVKRYVVKVRCKCGWLF